VLGGLREELESDAVEAARLKVDDDPAAMTKKNDM
jgi:hypothetical protein